MGTIKHIEILYLTGEGGFKSVTQPQIKGHTIEAWGIIIYHKVQAHFPHGKYLKQILCGLHHMVSKTVVSIVFYKYLCT